MNGIFGYISQTSLFGFLPLDIVAHLIVGFIITHFFLKIKMSFPLVIFFVFVIALGKEYKDSFILGDANTITESIKDIFFTLLPAALIYISVRAKRVATKSMEIKHQLLR